jgi:adenylate cyclase, class 2
MSTRGAKEVEIKFLVHSASQLDQALRDAGFTEKTASTFESNTLYDNALGELRRDSVVLRLRTYGDRYTLTHKSRGDKTRGEFARHKSRVELETTVGDADAAHSILSALGYIPCFRYEKYRAEWTDGTGEVVVDRTPIGEIAEIEGPPEWIDHIARIFGIKEADYITSSYADLFFQWKKRTGSAARNMTFEECGTPRP